MNSYLVTINTPYYPSQVANHLLTRSPEALESSYLPLSQSITILTFRITSNFSNHSTAVIIEKAIINRENILSDNNETYTNTFLNIPILFVLNKSFSDLRDQRDQHHSFI